MTPPAAQPLQCFIVPTIACKIVSVPLAKLGAAVVKELTLKVTNAPSSQYERKKHQDNNVILSTDPSKKAGKTLNYHMSELKAIEMLDGLCDRMHGYEPLKTEDGKLTIARSKTDKMYTDFMAFMRKSGKLGQDLDNEMQHEIAKKRDSEASWQVQLFCEDLVEDVEEVLSRAVRNFTHFNPMMNETDTAKLEEHVCIDTKPLCTPKKLRYFRNAKLEAADEPMVKTYPGGAGMPNLHKPEL